MGTGIVTALVPDKASSGLPSSHAFVGFMSQNGHETGIIRATKPACVKAGFVIEGDSANSKAASCQRMPGRCIVDQVVTCTWLQRRRFQLGFLPTIKLMKRAMAHTNAGRVHLFFAVA